MTADNISASNVNADTSCFSVKIAFNNELRRASFNGSFADLTSLVSKLFALEPASFMLKYEDEEADKITVTSDLELKEALNQAKTQVLRLFVTVKPAAPVAPVAPVLVPAVPATPADAQQENPLPRIGFGPRGFYAPFRGPRHGPQGLPHGPRGPHFYGTRFHQPHGPHGHPHGPHALPHESHAHPHESQDPNATGPSDGPQARPFGPCMTRFHGPRPHHGPHGHHGHPHGPHGPHGRHAHPHGPQDQPNDLGDVSQAHPHAHPHGHHGHPRGMHRHFRGTPFSPFGAHGMCPKFPVPAPTQGSAEPVPAATASTIPPTFNHGTFSPASDAPAPFGMISHADRLAFRESMRGMKAHMHELKQQDATPEARLAMKEWREKMCAARLAMKERRQKMFAERQANCPEMKERMECHRKWHNARNHNVELASERIVDVTIPDNSELPANAPATKTWRLKNVGTAAWPEGTQLVAALRRGDILNGPERVAVGALEPGQEVEVSVPFIAPAEPGYYVGFYRLATADGSRFGQRVWVSFVVPHPVHESREPVGLEVPLA